LKTESKKRPNIGAFVELLKRKSNDNNVFLADLSVTQAGPFLHALVAVQLTLFKMVDGMISNA
jgi:hypothetical protein